VKARVFTVILLVVTTFSLSLFNHGLLGVAYSIHHDNDIVLDGSGIPIVDYGCMGGSYIGKQINPVIVTHRAISYHDIYARTHDNESLKVFLNNSDWLVDNAVSKGNYSILPFYFPRPDYNLEPPWQSGMAQGKALQVLARAHEITGDQKYLDTAKKLLNSFFVEVKDGGVAFKTPEDGWWYEAFAGNSTTGPKVLNGMTYALLGIYEYHRYTQDPAAKYLFDQGILGLKNNLSQYEYSEGRYSTYDVLNNHTKPAPLNVHLSHARQLGILYDVTGEQLFKTYHDEWSDYALPSAIEQKFNAENTSNINVLFPMPNKK
jgi:heparosan-N-sulfate-glucuronate 5-epimerase